MGVCGLRQEVEGGETRKLRYNGQSTEMSPFIVEPLNVNSRGGPQLLQISYTKIYVKSLYSGLHPLNDIHDRLMGFIA